MTLKNIRALLLCYFELCASFHNHRSIQTGVTFRKRSIRVKIHYIFVSCDLEIWQMTLKNNRASLVCFFKRYAWFHSHLWIQTGVIVQKPPIRLKFGDFFLSRAASKFDRWPWKTIGHLSLTYFKLLALCRSHWGIQTGVTVWKRPIRAKIGDFFVPREFQIWQMTLQDNRAPREGTSSMLLQAIIS